MTFRIFTSAFIVLGSLFAGCAETVSPVSNENILELSKRSKTFQDSIPKASKLGLDKIVAFEEHAHFLFVKGMVGTTVQRMVVLKPSIVVVADGCMVRIFSIDDEEIEQLGKAEKCTEHQVIKTKLTFDLELPADETGMISVKQEDGKVLLARRPLPDGIMPHGSQGVKMIERWDRVYRGKNAAPWDTGKPSSELRKIVGDKTIKPGRAVVMGCGTGTNAIFLAQKGFEVTAIDVAPTSLIQARAKAKKAGVKVRWILASVLDVPDLGKFDFLFDRGCYHGVRRASASGYVNNAAKLVKTGGKALILAGNANEKKHYGPPRVKEEEIRKEFAGTFNIHWLKESKFDTRKVDRNGPMSWSILLIRK